MLYQIGNVQFTPGGLNPHEVSRETESDFAEKDVIGTLKPAEAVGEGDDTLKLTCLLFPQGQVSGLAVIDMLDAMRLSQKPQIVVRGDGYGYGWRRITSITEKGRKLDISGVGKVIEYEITLKKTPPPSAAGMVSALFDLLSSSDLLSPLTSILR